MLSAINQVFSAATVNIAGEYLQTNPRIGYVVIDVETREEEETLILSRAVRGQGIFLTPSEPESAAPAPKFHSPGLPRL